MERRETELIENLNNTYGANDLVMQQLGTKSVSMKYSPRATKIEPLSKQKSA